MIIILVATTTIDITLKNYSIAKFKNQHLAYYFLYEPMNFSCTNTTIVVLVNSKVDDFPIRKSIRSYWSSQMKLKTNKIRLLFVVSYVPDYDILHRLSEENRTFGDVLSTSIIESYHNLTYKMYAAYNWLNENCPQSALTFHVDSDVIVNIRAFNDYSQKLINTSWSVDKIFGNARQIRPVNRDKSDKKW
jgi:hypothetical protein